MKRTENQDLKVKENRILGFVIAAQYGGLKLLTMTFGMKLERCWWCGIVTVLNLEKSK